MHETLKQSPLPLPPSPPRTKASPGAGPRCMEPRGTAPTLDDVSGGVARRAAAAFLRGRRAGVLLGGGAAAHVGVVGGRGRQVPRGRRARDHGGPPARRPRGVGRGRGRRRARHVGGQGLEVRGREGGRRGRVGGRGRPLLERHVQRGIVVVHARVSGGRRRVRAHVGGVRAAHAHARVQVVVIRGWAETKKKKRISRGIPSRRDDVSLPRARYPFGGGGGTKGGAIRLETSSFLRNFDEELTFFESYEPKRFVRMRGAS